MLLRLRHIVLSCMLLFSAFVAAGQSTLPDTACLGATKHYWVDPTANSTYEWQVDGTVQPSTIFEIFITWTILGDHLLTVQETTVDNCIGEVKSLPVYVKNDPPTFTAPSAQSLCVEDIDTATYYDPTMDISPDRPEYYLFTPGDTHLDLNTTTFADDCCDTATLIIHWQIDFNGGIPSSIIGTGQPSSYGIDIQLPGDGFTFTDVVHTITYQLEDCFGSYSLPKTVNITIKPRPNVIKN